MSVVVYVVDAVRIGAEADRWQIFSDVVSQTFHTRNLDTMLARDQWLYSLCKSVTQQNNSTNDMEKTVAIKYQGLRFKHHNWHNIVH